jgi:hypothetical protein
MREVMLLPSKIADASGPDIGIPGRSGCDLGSYMHTTTFQDPSQPPRLRQRPTRIAEANVVSPMV